MIKNIQQYNVNLLPCIQKYGCLFLCFAYVSPMTFEDVTGERALNYLWLQAEEKKIIVDNEVKDHNGLARLFGLDVKYDDKHRNPEEHLPKNLAFLFGCFYWTGTHFVVLNRRLEVEFDPLKYSNTVKYGFLKSTRWYYANENA